MDTNGRVEAIFRDAEALLMEGLRELEAGNLRQAAEKTWGATMRATAALIIARTGEEPERSDQVSRALRQLALKDSRVDRSLVGRYYTRLNILHGDCFYHGMLEPREDIVRRIRETAAYIRDSRKLAASRDGDG